MFEEAKTDVRRTLGYKIRGRLDETQYAKWKAELDKLIPGGRMGIWDKAANAGMIVTLRVELPPGLGTQKTIHKPSSLS